ncbi:hypothetical protein BH20ACT2_BH20ACT2_08390 [soil metagenome]
MELTNHFEVGVPIEQAWAVLTDIELIAPCLPGVQLQVFKGDGYRGLVEVKVGPVITRYEGVARWVEQDEAGRRAVIRAKGREIEAEDDADIAITATFSADGRRTAVDLVTDLNVSGKLAQFGRGVLDDVGAQLLAQFLEQLEATVLAELPIPEPTEPTETVEPEPGLAPVVEAAPQADVAAVPGEIPHEESAAGAPAPEAADITADDSPPQPTLRHLDHAGSAPVEPLDVARGAAAKRAAPVAAALVVLWVLLRRRRSRRGSR